MNNENHKTNHSGETYWQKLLLEINSFSEKRTGKEQLNQVIKDGLKVYVTFPGCSEVSLFMAEYNSQNFYYSTSFPELNTKKSTSHFNLLDEEGIIRNAINNGKPQFYFHETEKKYFAVIPLIVPAGILGMVVLTLDKDPVYFEQIINGLLFQHTFTFAVIIQSHRLTGDIKSIETLFSQRVASRTVALEKTRRELKVILDSIITGILMTDKNNGKIIRANQTALELLGLESEQVLDKKISDFIIPSESSNQNQNYIEEIVINNQSEKIPVFRKTIDLYDKGFDFIIENFIDIRELKKTEAALRASEESYRKLFDSVDDAIYIQSKDGKFLDVNMGAVRMYGYDRSEIIGQYPTMLSADNLNDINKAKDLIDKAFEGVPQTFEFWGKRKNGEIFLKEVNLNKGYYFGEEAVIASARDITERKKAEDTIRESEQLFRSVWECSSEGMRLTDKDGIICSINEAFCNLVEKPREEIVNKSFSLLYGDEEYRNSDEKYKQRFISGDIRSFFEIEVTFWNGKKKWIALSNSFIVIDNNRKYLLSIFRDITERKKYESLQQALYDISESASSSVSLNELYVKIHFIIKNLMQANNFYIAQYDEKTDILSFPYFVDEFDEAPVSRKPLNGLTEYVLRTGKDLLATKEIDNELRKAGEVDIIGEPSEIWLGVPLKIDEKVFGVLVVQDYKNQSAYGEAERQILYFISEQIASAIYRKKSEEELLQFTEELKQSKLLLEDRAEELSTLNEQLSNSEKELKELIKEKDKFFSIVSHDLRSPFHGLLGFGEILVNEFDQLSKDEIKMFVERIYASSKNLYNLLNNLLEWSKLKTNKVDYIPENFIISEAIQQVIDLLSGNAINKQIQIVNDSKSNHIVFADTNMIKSVLQNLVSNAIKFSHPRGVITITTRDIGNRVLTSVSDTGIGISEGNIKRLLDENSFYSTKGTAEEMGSGLGLVLCKELIEKNCGTFNIESTPGKGSTFSFDLPQK